MSMAFPFFVDSEEEVAAKKSKGLPTKKSGDLVNTPKNSPARSKAPGKKPAGSKTPGRNSASSKVPGKSPASSKAAGKSPASSKTPGKGQSTLKLKPKQVTSISDFFGSCPIKRTLHQRASSSKDKGKGSQLPTEVTVIPESPAPEDSMEFDDMALALIQEEETEKVKLSICDPNVHLKPRKLVHGTIQYS